MYHLLDVLCLERHVLIDQDGIAIWVDQYEAAGPAGAFVGFDGEPINWSRPRGEAAGRKETGTF